MSHFITHYRKEYLHYQKERGILPLVTLTFKRLGNVENHYPYHSQSAILHIDPAGSNRRKRDTFDYKTCGVFHLSPPEDSMIIRAGGRQARDLGDTWAKKLVNSYCGRFVCTQADDQHVYVLRSDIAGAYKIGIAKDINGRINQLRSILDLPDLKLVHKILATNAGYLESFLHMIFADKYVEVGTSKEFFRLNRDDLRWLASLSNVDSRMMAREGLLTVYLPTPVSERTALIIRIGDLRELTVDQLRRIAEIVEGK